MADREAFVELYGRESEAILVFFTRRTLDTEVALDLTAETFAQAWRGWSRLRIDSSEEVRAWVFTIARRQLAHYLRRGRVERRALHRMGVHVPLLHEDDISEIERSAGLAQVRTAVSAALEKLCRDQRDAVRLRIVDELSYEEVARRLGTTEPTARARVSRGLRALACALDPDLAKELSAS